MKSHPQAFPQLTPGWGGKRAKERPPAQVGRAGGQGRGGHTVGTHSVEHNAKKSVHPLDEATEYLV